MHATPLQESERRERPLGRKLAGMFRRGRPDGATLLAELHEVVELDDPYAPGHPAAVPVLCRRVLQAMRVDAAEAELIAAAGAFHDLSRVRLPDALASRVGSLAASAVLDPMVEEIARDHPEFVRGLLMIRSHHERPDGRGSPNGVTEQDIPFGARVIAVCDAFASLTTDRTYRKGLHATHALRIMLHDRGRRWDPEIVSVLAGVVDMHDCRSTM